MFSLGAPVILSFSSFERNITTVRLARSLRLLLTLNVSIYYLSSREQGIRDNTSSFELSFLIYKDWARYKSGIAWVPGLASLCARAFLGVSLRPMPQKIACSQDTFPLTRATEWRRVTCT